MGFWNLKAYPPVTHFLQQDLLIPLILPKNSTPWWLCFQIYEPMGAILFKSPQCPYKESARSHSPIFKIFDPELLLSKGNAGTKMELKLKERPSRYLPNLGSIPCSGTKPWHYYWCHVVLADRSLAWLSSERLYQQLTEPDEDTYTQILDGGQGPLWKS